MIDGTVLCLVPEDRRAWHAGDQLLGRRRRYQRRSDRHRAGQSRPSVRLSALCRSADAGAGRAVRGASWRAIPSRPIACSAIPTWRRRARSIPASCSIGGGSRRAGIGLWPEPPVFPIPVPPQLAGRHGASAANLARFGYDVGVTGISTAAAATALAAFQRHFHPCRFNGEPDGEHAAAAGGADRPIAVSLSKRRLTRRRPRLPDAAPDGRMAALRACTGEESPGSTETRCRVTPGGGDPRDSATESKPPAAQDCGPAAGARVKGCGKSAPRRR